MMMILDVLDFANFCIQRTYGTWALTGFVVLGILSLLRLLLIRGWRA